MAYVTPDADPNPWVPETDLERLKVLGKSIEEVCELGAALARCIIQGIDEAEPVTGKPNRIWTQEEIADVEANLEILKARFTLDREFIRQRRDRKFGFLMRWLPMGRARP